MITQQATIVAIAGNGQSCYSGDNGAASSATLSFPISIAACGGNVIISDTNNRVLRKVDGAGIIRTIAGTGAYGYSGDGGPAIAAVIAKPWTVTVEASGSILFVDYDNDVIRRIDAAGVIRTVAGNHQV